MRIADRFADLSFRLFMETAGRRTRNRLLRAAEEPAAAQARTLSRQTILLHELEQGRDHHVVVSTEAGLLRYHMNDVLRAGEPIGRTPSLFFIRKGRGVTNITGEKLSEDQVHLAMAEAMRACRPRARFFVVVAMPALSGYRAFVEFHEAMVDPGAFASALDETLCKLNIVYAAKRRSRRLHPLELAPLKPGTADAYRRHCVQIKGQRESQLKVLALQTADECDFDFEAHMFGDAPLTLRQR